VGAELGASGKECEEMKPSPRSDSCRAFGKWRRKKTCEFKTEKKSNDDFSCHVLPVEKSRREGEEGQDRQRKVGKELAQVSGEFFLFDKRKDRGTRPISCRNGDDQRSFGFTLTSARGSCVRRIGEWHKRGGLGGVRKGKTPKKCGLRIRQ